MYCRHHFSYGGLSSELKGEGQEKFWGEAEVPEENVIAAWSRGGEGTVFLYSGHGSLQCYGPGRTPIKKGWGFSLESLTRTPERYQDPVL